MAGVRDLIDDLLRAEKTLGGTPDWRPVGERGEFRQLIPLLINGVATSAHVELNAYPYIIDELRFRIMILAPKCIWRVDYVTDEQHLNPLDAPAGAPAGFFAEPHYHAWEDNRQFATAAALPDRLPVARIFEPRIRQFDATFRWFCGMTNISQPPAGMIDLPPRTRLL